MGEVIVRHQLTVNGAFEAPGPEEGPALDADSGDTGLEQLILALATGVERYPQRGRGSVQAAHGVGPIRLQLVSATPSRSGVIWLRQRPAGA